MLGMFGLGTKYPVASAKRVDLSQFTGAWFIHGATRIPWQTVGATNKTIFMSLVHIDTVFRSSANRPNVLVNSDAPRGHQAAAAQTTQALNFSYSEGLESVDRITHHDGYIIVNEAKDVGASNTRWLLEVNNNPSWGADLYVIEWDTSNNEWLVLGNEQYVMIMARSSLISKWNYRLLVEVVCKRGPYRLNDIHDMYHINLEGISENIRVAGMGCMKCAPNVKYCLNNESAGPPPVPVHNTYAHPQVLQSAPPPPSQATYLSHPPHLPQSAYSLHPPQPFQLQPMLSMQSAVSAPISGAYPQLPMNPSKVQPASDTQARNLGFVLSPPASYQTAPAQLVGYRLSDAYSRPNVSQSSHPSIVPSALASAPLQLQLHPAAPRTTPSQPYSTPLTSHQSTFQDSLEMLDSIQ